jgi:hypothetical protein
MGNWKIEHYFKLRHVYIFVSLPFLNLSAKRETLNYKTNNSLVVRGFG